MKVHLACINDEPTFELLAAKIQEAGHENVESGDRADVVLMVITMNNGREAMNWIPVLWDVKPTTPVIFVESDYPNRIFGSLEAECSVEDLNQALKSMVAE